MISDKSVLLPLRKIQATARHASNERFAWTLDDGETTASAMLKIKDFIVTTNRDSGIF